MKNYTLNATTQEQKQDISPCRTLRVTADATAYIRLQSTPKPKSQSELEDYRPLTANVSYQIKTAKNAVWAVWYKAASTATITVQSSNEDVTPDAGTVSLSGVTVDVDVSSLALESGGNLAAIKADVDKIPSLGQALMAASTPVTIASNQSPLILHDATEYKTAIFLGTASGNLVAAVTSKSIKVHYLDIQAQGTETIDIKDDTSGNIIDQWQLQAREGAVKSFVPYPAYHYKSASGKPLYVALAAGGNSIKICVIYRDADA
jgi:hypothetical protein